MAAADFGSSASSCLTFTTHPRIFPMESKPNDSPRKPSERKGHSQSNNNAILYVLALGVVVLLLFSVWSTRREVDISYSDLLALVAASNPTQPDAPGYIEVLV